jgi:hypothetical protein
LEQDVVDGEVVAEEVAPSQEVAVRSEPSGSVTLFGTSDPAEVMQVAGRVASVLTDVLKRQGLTSNISGRHHVRVEGWQTVGSMLGVFPVLEEVVALPWPEPVPDALANMKSQGKTFGFTARYRAQRADGSVVGGGEADCTRTESTWKSRDDYALKSMAQTRATSKALKAPLGFVVSLAGYEATPAEEMPSSEDESTRRLVQANTEALASLGRVAAYFRFDGKDRSRLMNALEKDGGGIYPHVSVKAILHLAAIVRDIKQREEKQVDGHDDGVAGGAGDGGDGALFRDAGASERVSPLDPS